MGNLNSFLLLLFTENERFGHDVESLHRRFQILSLIYLNLGFSMLAMTYNLVTWTFFDSEHLYLLISICLPLIALSLLLIRYKKLDASAIFIILSLHASNVISSDALRCPMASLYGSMIYPCFISFLASSLKIHMFNGVLCLAGYFYNAYRIQEIFQVTFTDDQSRQISSLYVGGLHGVIFAIIVSAVQKTVELNIWRLAQEQHLKSENLTKEVIQAMEAKDSFVSTLSHEIRNPLNSLKGSIDYLFQVVKNEEYIKVLRNAKLSGEVLLNLVSNALDAAKLKSDKMEIACMETDLLSTIKKVLTINSENLKDKGLFANAYLDEALPKLIWIDPSRLLQILMNLVSNAIKFTPRGGNINIYVSWCSLNQDKASLLTLFDTNRTYQVVNQGRNQLTRLGSAPALVYNLRDTFEDRDDLSISQEFSFQEAELHCKRIQSVTTSKATGPNDLNRLALPSNFNEKPWAVHIVRLADNRPIHKSNNSLSNRTIEDFSNKGYLKIQVSDTGCGIAENDLPKLFGMFEQAAQGVRLAQGGTGLGLWICKQLIQKMNGEITVHSKPNQGTSFVLYVPVNNDQISATAMARPRPVTNRAIKVLVVDDYSLNRYLHKLLLEQQGVQVTLANDGKEALEKYKAQNKGSFDFVMMDVQMPVMDGFTSAKLMREWEVQNNIRKVDIYFVTGEYFSEDEVLARFENKGGLNDRIRCLRKPLDGEIIKKVVKLYTSASQ